MLLEKSGEFFSCLLLSIFINHLLACLELALQLNSILQPEAGFLFDGVDDQCGGGSGGHDKHTKPSALVIMQVLIPALWIVSLSHLVRCCDRSALII